MSTAWRAAGSGSRGRPRPARLLDGGGRASCYGPRVASSWRARRVPHPLDAEQVAVEQMPQGLRQAVGCPRRLVAPEGVGQRAIDPLGSHEVAQGVEAAIPSGPAEGEGLVDFPVGDDRGRVRRSHLRRGSFRGVKWSLGSSLLPRRGPFPSADSRSDVHRPSHVNARPLRNRGSMLPRIGQVSRGTASQTRIDVAAPGDQGGVPQLGLKPVGRRSAAARCADPGRRDRPRAGRGGPAS
jgi:hypothetical protein